MSPPVAFKFSFIFRTFLKPRFANKRSLLRSLFKGSSWRPTPLQKSYPSKFYLILKILINASRRGRITSPIKSQNPPLRQSGHTIFLISADNACPQGHQRQSSCSTSKHCIRSRPLGAYTTIIPSCGHGIRDTQRSGLARPD